MKCNSIHACMRWCLIKSNEQRFLQLSNHLTNFNDLFVFFLGNANIKFHFNPTSLEYDVIHFIIFKSIHFFFSYFRIYMLFYIKKVEIIQD